MSPLKSLLVFCFAFLLLQAGASSLQTREPANVISHTKFRPGPARSEVFEVDLGDLIGDFPYFDANGDQAWARYHTFTYTGPDAKLLDVFIHLDGFAEVGWIECDFWPPRLDTLKWYVDPSGFLRKVGVSGFWLGSPGQALDGSFSVTSDLHAFSGGSFSRLATGDRLQVRQLFAPGGMVDLCHPISEDPGGRITSARLTLEIDPIVSVEPTTWGRIKALYE